VKLGTAQVAIAHLEGRWSVVSRGGGAAAASLDAALRAVQSS